MAAFLTSVTLSSSATTFTTPRSVCTLSRFSRPTFPFSTHAKRFTITSQQHGHSHGHGHDSTATSTRRPGEHKGFVEEMRFVAMRLHTKDQAPKEGQQERSALPIDAWYPSKNDFLQFLIDSRTVYSYFENELVLSNDNMFSKFKNTGLERLKSLDQDISYVANLTGLTDNEIPKPTNAAVKYVDYLRNLIKTKPECVLCHWYNYYFAHSAGGRMIGRLMQDRLFQGHNFQFYQWEEDVKEVLNRVRVIIDGVAKDWPRDVKDECLKETGLAFGYSGTVLQNLAKSTQ